MNTSRLGRLAAATMMGGTALVAIPAVASAQSDAAQRDVGAIVDALVASGLPEDVIDDELEDRLRKAVDDLVDADVIEPEDLDELRDDVESGDPGEAIAERLQRGRQRQADYRDAVEAVLADRDIVLEDGESARDALRDQGLSNDQIKDILPKRRTVRCDVERDCYKPKGPEAPSDDDRKESGSTTDRSEPDRVGRKAEKERAKDRDKKQQEKQKENKDSIDDDRDDVRITDHDDATDGRDDDDERPTTTTTSRPSTSTSSGSTTSTWDDSSSRTTVADWNDVGAFDA